MQHRLIRALIFAALGAFLPLFYYLAVVGGLLPYGAMLLIAARHLGDSTMLWFSLVHLAVYGALLYGLSGLVTRLILRFAGGHAWPATAGVVLLLAALGLLPLFGIAHGHVQWMDAYALYASPALR